jgi:hypothetical protein
MARVTVQINENENQNTYNNVKFTLEQATKALFNLGSKWRWVVKATVRPLYPDKENR